MINKISEIRTWMSKKRTWWIKRNIPQEIAETILQHSKKVAKAASIYGKNIKGIDINLLIKMGKYHDVAEYKEKDYIPWEIPDIEKHEREKAVMKELEEYFWIKWIELFNIWMNYELWESKESKIVKQLDKLDAAIQAMEYEKLGHNQVTDFYNYTFNKLSDPVLINIFNILLKREFLNIWIYEQYFILLECNWDEDVFKKKILEFIKF